MLSLKEKVLDYVKYNSGITTEKINSYFEKNVKSILKKLENKNLIIKVLITRLDTKNYVYRWFIK